MIKNPRATLFAAAMAIFFIILAGGLGSALAQEPPAEPTPEPTPPPAEPPPAEPTPPPPAEPPPPAVENVLPVGWMILLGRVGGTAGNSGGEFNFDQVPAGMDQKTAFNSQQEYFGVGGIEALFFPTAGRHFMITASLLGQISGGAMNFDRDEYGYRIGLHNRLLWQRMGHLMGGLGYRFLYGDRDQHASTVHFKLGLGSAAFAIDGFANGAGGSGILELGGNYMYRFDNRMIMGIQLDLRLWAAGFREIEAPNLATEFDLTVGGGAALFSVILGWETL